MPSATDKHDETAADIARQIAKLEYLIQALEDHPLMNHANPHESPKAFFWTWDFVHRTRHNLTQISIPALDANEPQALEKYSDALGRCMMSRMMICDTSGQTIRAMTLGQEPVDFGEVARERAEALRPS